MQTILLLAELTRQQTNGYFNIYQDGHFNPSGIVKGWAIQQAANMLRERGMQNYYVDAGGDMAVRGTNWWGNRGASASATHSTRHKSSKQSP